MDDAVPNGDHRLPTSAPASGMGSDLEAQVAAALTRRWDDQVTRADARHWLRDCRQSSCAWSRTGA